jgi:hypothetical protein
MIQSGIVLIQFPDWFCEAVVDRETMVLSEGRDPALERGQMNRDKTRREPSVYERDKLT